MAYVGNPLPANFQASPAVVRFSGDAPAAGTNNVFVYFLELAGGNITPAAENKGNFKFGGMFRTNSQTVDVNTTIEATENATATGPLTVSSGITITVNSGGNLAII